jgi:hypothetical protein
MHPRLVEERERDRERKKTFYYITSQFLPRHPFFFVSFFVTLPQKL